MVVIGSNLRYYRVLLEVAMTRHQPEFGSEINLDFVGRVRSYQILTSDFRGAQVPVEVSVSAKEVKQVKSVMN